jgi:hypothetical protein
MADSSAQEIDNSASRGDGAAPALLTPPAAGNLPQELALAMRGLYVLAGVVATQAPQREQESSDYGACRVELDGRAVVFRVAKTTPTKVGQFVTLWKRPMPNDEIAPLDSDDGVDLVIVSVADTTHRGQFVFNKHALLKHGVMSRNGHGGKRGIRVYPPWTKPVAKDAIKTQQWQLLYFVGLAPQNAGAAERLRQLIHNRRTDSSN